MNKHTRNAVILAVANLAITAFVIGCGESVPQRSAQGGVLSGTETERNRYANKRNPLLAGNAQEEVRSASATPSALTTAAPRTLTTAPAPSGTATVGSPAGTGADPRATASPESAPSGTPRAGTPAPPPPPAPRE